jgi:hypothetical protein
MTQAALWRQQLQGVAAALSREVSAQVVPGFRTLLGNLPHSPAWCGRLLDSLNSRLDAKRRCMPENSEDLEASLAGLDAAVAARPNGVVLGARHALWLFPALAAGIAILHALYPLQRATVFSGLLIVGGLAAGSIGVLRRLWKAQKVVLAARDRALDIVTSRHEAILSANAVAYLDDVIGTLRQALRRCRDDLDQYMASLGQVSTDLVALVSSDLPDRPPLGPILARPEEFEAMVAALGISVEPWLAEAARPGMFDGLYDPAADRIAWTERLLRWCQDRVLSGEGTTLPSYGDLWRIRRQARGEGAVASAIETLWHRAAPATDATLTAGNESALILVPVELAGEVRANAPTLGYRSEDVVETRTIPMLCCMRRGRLEILKRVAP